MDIVLGNPTATLWLTLAGIVVGVIVVLLARRLARATVTDAMERGLREPSVGIDSAVEAFRRPLVMMGAAIMIGGFLAASPTFYFGGLNMVGTQFAIFAVCLAIGSFVGFRAAHRNRLQRGDKLELAGLLDRQQHRSRRWTWIAIALQTVLGLLGFFVAPAVAVYLLAGAVAAAVVLAGLTWVLRAALEIPTRFSEVPSDRNWAEFARGDLASLQNFLAVVAALGFLAGGVSLSMQWLNAEDHAWAEEMLLLWTPVVVAAGAWAWSIPSVSRRPAELARLQPRE